MRRTLLLVLGLSVSLSAQSGVRSLPDGKTWILDAGQSSYAVGVNDHNMLQSLYWGSRLPDHAVLPTAQSSPGRASFDPSIATTPLEYPAWGAGLFTEPALKVDSPNGDRTLILEFVKAEVKDSILDVTLHDPFVPVTVHLFYQPFPEGILGRWSRIENEGSSTVQIEQIASATWNLPAATDYSLSWLTGQWAGEFQLHSAPIQAGTQVLESRRGSTSHQANPWFSIGRQNQTTETAGPVWFGELGWSGSWRITVESTALNKVRVTGGFNPYDFRYPLMPGASLETPHFYGGYTSQGEGEASRILHRFQLAEILPTHPNPKPRPIVYDSWEATGFGVNEQGQIALAERAAKLGVERFVIDDGWFGQRKDDHAGLGDWYVNPQKFPNGLKPVIDKVHALGMDFGIWVEPEMVNPDSDLYRKHPNWAMQLPGRQRTQQRNQLVLNLAREDVKEYVFHWLDDLVSNNDIAFLKWDYNRNWSEPGWSTAPGSFSSHPSPDAEKQIYVRFVLNVYDILARLRQKHPKLEIESCSGGGGRVDLGILHYADEVWPSDNTDALDRLSIQYGFTHAYSPETMVAWVTDVPNFLDNRRIPLEFRFFVMMQGALGIGGNLNNWSDEDLDTAARMTAFYKQIRTTVQQGNLYRLASPLEGDASQVEYVSQDGKKGVVLAYLHSQRYGMDYPAVLLQGLDPNATYKIMPYDTYKYKGPDTATGAWLMNTGLQLDLSGDYAATAIRLEKQ